MKRKHRFLSLLLTISLTFGNSLVYSNALENNSNWLLDKGDYSQGNIEKLVEKEGKEYRYSLRQAYLNQRTKELPDREKDPIQRSQNDGTPTLITNAPNVVVTKYKDYLDKIRGKEIENKQQKDKQNKEKKEKDKQKKDKQKRKLTTQETLEGYTKTGNQGSNSLSQQNDQNKKANYLYGIDLRPPEYRDQNYFTGLESKVYLRSMYNDISIKNIDSELEVNVFTLPDTNNESQGDKFGAVSGRGWTKILDSVGKKGGVWGSKEAIKGQQKDQEDNELERLNRKVINPEYQTSSQKYTNKNIEIFTMDAKQNKIHIPYTKDNEDLKEGLHTVWDREYSKYTPGDTEDKNRAGVKINVGESLMQKYGHKNLCQNPFFATKMVEIAGQELYELYRGANDENRKILDIWFTDRLEYMSQRQSDKYIFDPSKEKEVCQALVNSIVKTLPVEGNYFKQTFDNILTQMVNNVAYTRSEQIEEYTDSSLKESYWDWYKTLQVLKPKEDELKRVFTTMIYSTIDKDLMSKDVLAKMKEQSQKYNENQLKELDKLRKDLDKILEKEKNKYDISDIIFDNKNDVQKSLNLPPNATNEEIHKAIKDEVIKEIDNLSLDNIKDTKQFLNKMLGSEIGDRIYNSCKDDTTNCYLKAVNEYLTHPAGKVTRNSTLGAMIASHVLGQSLSNAVNKPIGTQLNENILQTKEGNYAAYKTVRPSQNLINKCNSGEISCYRTNEPGVYAIREEDCGKEGTDYKGYGLIAHGAKHFFGKGTTQGSSYFYLPYNPNQTMSQNGTPSRAINGAAVPGNADASKAKVLEELGITSGTTWGTYNLTEESLDNLKKTLKSKEYIDWIVNDTIQRLNNKPVKRDTPSDPNSPQVGLDERPLSSIMSEYEIQHLKDTLNKIGIPFIKVDNVGKLKTFLNNIKSQTIDTENNKIYRLYNTTVFRVSYNQPLDVIAKPIEYKQVIKPTEVTFKIKYCGKLEQGSLKEDIPTIGTVNFEPVTSITKDKIYKNSHKIADMNDRTTSGIQLKNIDPRHKKATAEDNQIVYKNREKAHCIESEEFTVKRTKTTQQIKVLYKINSTEKKPEKELTYKNNVATTVLEIPPIENPDLIAKRVKIRFNPPPDPNSPPPATVNVCVQGDGTSEGIPDDEKATSKHRLTINGKTMSGSEGKINPKTGKKEFINEICEEIPYTPQVTGCYEINPPTRDLKYQSQSENIEETTYTNNIVCETVDIPNNPPDKPQKPQTPPIGCGAYMNNAYVKNTTHTYNVASIHETMGIPAKTNMHATGKILGYKGDHVFTPILREGEPLDENEYPPSFAWYDSMQARENQYNSTGEHPIEYNRFTVGDGNQHGYHYTGPETTMDGQPLRVHGYGNAGYGATPCSPACNSTCTWSPGKDFTNWYGTGVGGTPIQTVCTKWHEEPRTGTSSRSCGCDDDGCWDYTTKSPTPSVKVCDLWAHDVSYASSSPIEYNALVEMVNKPRLVSFDQFKKLDEQNTIKSGYGFTVPPSSYHFATDWEYDMKTNPFMVRPEKENKLNSHYSHTYSDPETGGLDGIGIKDGNVNGAYLGDIPIDGEHGNQVYNSRGYNRIVDMGKETMLPAYRTKFWAAINSSGRSQYEPLPNGTRHYTDIKIDYNSDLSRMKDQGMAGVRWKSGNGQYLGKDDWSPKDVYAGISLPKHIIYLKYRNGRYEVENWPRVDFKSHSHSYSLYDCIMSEINVKGSMWDDNYVVPSDEGRGTDSAGNQKDTQSYTEKQHNYQGWFKK